MRLPTLTKMASELSRVQLQELILCPTDEAAVRQTLFFIPHEIAGVPFFGVGCLLGAWLLFGFVWLLWLVRKHGWKAETLGVLPFLALVAVVIVFVLPRFEVADPSGELLGLPIRGYGTFVLSGFGAGFWLAVRRAQQRMISSEVISALAVWMFFGAFIGARLFFVIEYWDNFHKPTLRETITEVFKLTEGGLVVYGALLGGLPALYLFSRRHRIPALLLCDTVAPGLALGLAFGRIGCLMNGCCYGGVCEEGPICITFPKYNSIAQLSLSPPYEHQLVLGRLHGFQLGKDQKDGRPTIIDVDSGSPAARAGVEPGEKILAINGRRTDDLTTASEILERSGSALTLTTQSGKNISWNVGKLPSRSLPVHPAQIYSAVNAILICLLLMAAEPYLPRVGSVLALTLTIYPVLRIIEEVIRVDEPGQFGTQLSISQIISLGLLVVAGLLWILIIRAKPPVPAT